MSATADTKGFPLLGARGVVFKRGFPMYKYRMKFHRITKSRKKRLCALVSSWQRQKKAEKSLMRSVVKFSEKNVLQCEVHKNGGSGNKRIEINTDNTEYSYKR